MGDKMAIGAVSRAAVTLMVVAVVVCVSAGASAPHAPATGSIALRDAIDAGIERAATAAAPVFAPRDDSAWVLTFEDDFSGTALNTSIWQPRNNETHCAPCEPELYVDEDVYLEDGASRQSGYPTCSRDGGAAVLDVGTCTGCLLHAYTTRRGHARISRAWQCAASTRVPHGSRACVMAQATSSFARSAAQ